MYKTFELTRITAFLCTYTEGSCLAIRLDNFSKVAQSKTVNVANHPCFIHQNS